MPIDPSPHATPHDCTERPRHDLARGLPRDLPFDDATDVPNASPDALPRGKADRATDLGPGDPPDVGFLADVISDLNISSPMFLMFDHDGRLETSNLDADDPVERLFGLVVQGAVSAVGICAPATVTLSSIGHMDETDHTVIHIVNRQGTSVTRLISRSGSRWFGPSAEPQKGRVPDACRRVLGLPTCPPVDSMTDFVLVAWLEIIARHALDRPGLDWSEIITLHPASHSVLAPVTPTALARATLDLGNALDWERFRRVIATVGGFPFGDHATEVAVWMDDGMFSRWAMESLPSRDETLNVLGSILGPGTFDRLWATVRFCE